MFKLLSINFMIFFMFNLANPMIPAMLEMKNSPDYLNGFLFAAMNLSQFIFSPIVVKMYDYVKPKTLIMIGPFLYGVAQIGFAMFDAPSAMIVMRLLSGCAVAFVQVSILVYTHSIVVKSSKINKYSLLFASNSLGGICGLYLASLIAPYSITATFYLQAILGFIFIFISFLFLTRLKEPNIEKKKEPIFASLTVIFTTKRVFILFLLMTLFISGFVVFNSNINNFATQQYQISARQSSYVSMGITSLVFITNIFFVNLASKFKLYNLLISVCVVVLALFLNLYYDTSLINALLTFSILILSFNLVRPLITSALVSELSTSDAAKYLSATNSINSFASIFAGVATGIVYSINPIYMFYLIFCLLLAAFIILLTRKKDVKV